MQIYIHPTVRKPHQVEALQRRTGLIAVQSIKNQVRLVAPNDHFPHTTPPSGGLAA